MDDCIFCKIAKGDVDSEKIYENDNFFSVKDINQKVEGHSLVISKEHFETFLDMPTSLSSDLVDCLKNTSTKVMEEVGAEGFNIANNNSEVAGQVVHHLHFHILPRKKNDGFKWTL